MQKSPKKDKREQEGLVADKVFATFLNSLIMHSKIAIYNTEIGLQIELQVQPYTKILTENTCIL